MTPMLVKRVVFAVAETRSDERASMVLREVGGHSISDSTAARVTWEVGQELAARRDAEESRSCHSATLADGASPPRVETPPELAVVMCDGGRIRTRAQGQGRGVHQPAWRETKNACLLRMTHCSAERDPHPELPRAFRDSQTVAKLAEKQPLELPPPDSEADVVEADWASDGESDWRPRRLVRTCLASMATSDAFGRQMAREARRRRFYDAPHRAFVGDGLPWNWSIWQEHFADFVPILDFMHALSYVYRAALVLSADANQVWGCYLALARACWQGRVVEVIQALQHWLAEQDVADPATLADDDPRSAVATAVRYLTNNQTRMNYPDYRRLGLPVTSAHMESLVKEINLRVKGTEMFWNDAAGAEAILQIRAAALCDDHRLAHYLTHRPGHPYIRRSTPVTAA